MRDTAALLQRAREARTVVPGFNIPYLPMMAPVVRALRDTGCFGLIMVARLEWIKFASGSLTAIRDEYARVQDPRHTRLHLDHVPVLDEDGETVDAATVIREALALGYDSVMIDGSRLPFAANVAATREIVALAHAQGVPVEAELGAVLYGLIPNLQQFWLADALAGDGTIPWSYVAAAALYALCLLVFLLAAGMLVFGRMEVKA